MILQLSTTVHQIGSMIAARNIGIVYGGGRTGLMGAIADGALSKAAMFTAIIPNFLEKPKLDILDALF